jgi:hypothetical protein
MANNSTGAGFLPLLFIALASLGFAMGGSELLPYQLPASQQLTSK